MAYQLDFKETHADKDNSYLQLYSEYGWECVVSNTQMMIFWEPVQIDDDLTIFSDKESQIEMIRSLFSSCLLLFVVAYLPLSSVLRSHSLMGEFGNGD